MGLNENQMRCATTFGRAVATEAGAGSGKTTTVTQRIVNAFDPQVTAGQMEPLTSIDQVLAITFTERAASELKSRVKDALRTRGLVEQSLHVDDAWIGTIHGMCSRIIRECALTLGVDPAFRVLSDDARATMLDEAIERTLLSGEGLADDVDRLFAEYQSDAIKGMVSELVDAAAKSSREFDSLEGPTLSPETAGVVERFRVAVGRYLADGVSDGEPPIAGLVEMSRFLEDMGCEGSFDGTSGEIRWRLPWGEDLTKAKRRDLCELMLRQAEAARLWGPLERVARACHREFCDAKVQKGWFDNDDLLIWANRALGLPEVAARYRDRFGLVVVDEFQDTDQTQLDVIRRLSGPNCERLCVVGDPQQSIYRFRGADLAVCESYLHELPEGDRIPLYDNYRSHACVLDFVDVAYGDEDGIATRPADHYQRLNAARDEARVSEAQRLKPGEGPHVEVLDAEYLNGREGVARRLVADRIAERFERMHETGRPFGDMTILLGKMTNADVYAKALDDRGIPCAVTGGSVLNKKTDANAMVALARTLANPRDAEAAVGLLESDLFGLDDADLMALVECATLPGEGRSPSLGTAFARLVGGGFDRLPPRLSSGRAGLAVRVMERAYERLGREQVSRVMEGVLAESGWLSRMQSFRVSVDPEDDPAEGAVSVSGQARAADALKVIRMVEDLENEGLLGARAVSDALKTRLAGVKEAPGVLSAEGSDFVRIMTIHASKGLEFPVCACAELDRVKRPSTSKVSVKTVAGTSYVSLDLQGSLVHASRFMNNCNGKPTRETALERLAEKAPYDVLDRDALGRLLHAAEKRGDLAGRTAALAAYDDEQEDEELERKLYVAFTRAEEALIVCMTTQVKVDVLRKRLEAMPEYAAVVKLARKTGKSAKTTEVTDAKKRVAELMRHVSLPFAAEPTGALGRIRARRERMAGNEGFAYLHASAASVERWDATGELPGAWTGDPDEEGAFLEFDDARTGAAVVAVEGVSRVPAQMPAPAPPRLRYAPLAQLGVLSASALHENDREERVEVPPSPEVSYGDEDAAEASATERGTAFHMMGEVAARRWRPGQALELPEDRLDPTAVHYGLSRGQRDALGREMRSWLGSPVARDMAAHARLEPEVPFYVPMPRPAGAAPLSLTGFIDLLAFDRPGAGVAEVVDYKTGYSLDTDARRREAYEVQARVYAYALARRGFESVRLRFVFVDQPDAGGEPAVCEFGPWGLEACEEFLRDLEVD